MAGLRGYLCLVLPFVFSMPTCADGPADGTWKVSHIASPSTEATNWIVKLETKDGKATGTMVATNPRMNDAKVEKASVEGTRIRIVFKVLGKEHVFEGQVSPKEKDRVSGVYDDDRRLYIASLVRTDLSALKQSDINTPREMPNPMKQALELTTKPMQLRAKANRIEDPEEKKKLLGQAVAAAADAETERPKLYEKVLADHPDDIAVFDAGMNLLRAAGKSKTDAAKVKQWATTVAKASEMHDARCAGEMLTQIAETLAPMKEYAPVALDFAQQAEKQLRPNDTATNQMRVLKALLAAAHITGKTPDAALTQTRVDKLEDILDQEYHTKVPPLKPEAYSGRKASSDRAVVMELFTGAQCPPCVAADVAFDALAKAYKPSELILLQYHLHIPGPDPLTNSDSEARWNLYRKQFPDKMRGTPSTAFNGKPQAGGGGGLDNAEKKLTEYRGIIDPLLEEAAGGKMKASAVASGDKVSIKVEVADVKEKSDDLRLCVILVEENVRYVGGNKLRFHHYVVRAIPTGAEGVALPEAGQSYTTTIDLKGLRDSLSKYLDNYSENTRPFPNMDRPMQFKNLRVVAFVQDATTKEIVQGTAVDLAGQSARR